MSHAGQRPHLHLGHECAVFVVSDDVGIRSSKNIKQTGTDFSSKNDTREEQSSNDIDFKHKPNVYILFLESLHSADAAKTIYDIDSSELYSRMQEKKLDIYDNTYSNLFMTEISFSSMVWPEMMHNPYHFRESSRLMPSKIFNAFKQNGYGLNLFSSDYLKSRFSDLFDHCKTEAANAGSVAIACLPLYSPNLRS